jgi:hypothetical protein
MFAKLNGGHGDDGDIAAEITTAMSTPSMLLDGWEAAKMRKDKVKLFLSASKSWRTSVVRVLPVPPSDVPHAFRCNARLNFPYYIAHRCW